MVATNSTSRNLARALNTLLVAVTMYHLCKGFYYLALQQPPTAIADFYNRQTENAYFLHRISPLSEYFLFKSKSQHDRSAESWAIGADSFSDGFVYAGGLPPWTYPLQLAAYIPTASRPARLYLAVLDLIALVGMAALGARAVHLAGGRVSACWTGALGALAIGRITTPWRKDKMASSSMALSRSRCLFRMTIHIPAGEWRQE
jgi:hypothetical protein